MVENKNILCYNRGCGKMFDPNNNETDTCRHHPGTPVFHDAYKGWSCCNKKSVDFTEFLNIPGCTLSKHSNEKPIESEKKGLDKELENKEVIEVRAPVLTSQIPRPPLDTPLVTLKANIADSLREVILQQNKTKSSSNNSEVSIGTSCKNGGCSETYQGPQTNDIACTHHPGCPVFHEGLKFWSCCQKRTTDFNTFLNQAGCNVGVHKWKKEETSTGKVKCRWDWHQTPGFVIVSVYAKKYDPNESFVKLNPIRLVTQLAFPDEGLFELDLELRGVINIEESSASMLSTKLEIKLKKAEPGSWAKLEVPQEVSSKQLEQSKKNFQQDGSVDLSTVEAIQSIGKVNMNQ